MTSEEDNNVSDEENIDDHIEISLLAQQASSIDDLINIAKDRGLTPEQFAYAANQRFSDKTAISYYKMQVTPTTQSGFFNKYFKHLVDNGWNEEHSGTVKKIMDNVEETYARITHKNQPIAEKNRSGYGLVVGRIQSGKTAHMIGLCMRAMDKKMHPPGEEYDTVILLSGLLEDLRLQTYSRLVDARISGINIIPRKSDFTSKNDDARAELFEALSLIEPCILVVKKNHLVLEAIIDYLDEPEIRMQLKERRILIIDDECDHASIDSTHSEMDSSKKSKSITATNRAVRKLIKKFGKTKHTCWYIGYTATPYSNLLMHPEPKYLDDHNLGASLFPRDMIHCLPKPRGHMDNEYFFNDDAEPYIQQFEIPSSDSGDERKHLRNLLLLHVISKLLRSEKTKSDFKAHTTMIHTDVEIDEHIRVAEIIRKIKKEYHDMSAKEIYSQMVECSTKYYPDQLKIINQIISRYEKSRHIKIQKLFTKSKIVVLNSDEEQEDAEYKYPTELGYDSKEEVSIIIVGGQKLSRGLTLEGLTITWFARTPKKPNYDTLLQMARWSGYRESYEEFIRIFMNLNTIGHFQLITEVERRLRTDLRKFTKETNPMDEVQWIREYNGMAITGRAPKNLTENPSTSKVISPEFMLDQLPENYSFTDSKGIQDSIYDAFEDLEFLHSGEFVQAPSDSEFEIAPTSFEYIESFLKRYQDAYEKSCDCKKYLTQLLAEVSESESLSEWNLVIHQSTHGRELSSHKLSTLGFKTGLFNHLRCPKTLPKIDFSPGITFREKPMLCIFLEDPNHKIAGHNVYSDNDIPIVMIGFYLPPESISAQFIEMARPGVELPKGEEE